MRTRATKKQVAKTSQRKQINLRVEPALYRALETFARREQRSVSQAARQLMEEGLRQRVAERATTNENSSQEIAALAAAGGAFDWLAEEPDLYDDTCGEPL